MKEKRNDPHPKKDIHENAECPDEKAVGQTEAADSEQGGDTPSPENSADERAAELERENAELKDQYLRKVADFDNYRKRMIREKQDAFDYANTSLLSDLLDSLDNFDRALEASSSDPAAIVQGVEMTKKQLVNMLESKYNLLGYGQKGDVFDPSLHEAIGSMPGAVSEPTCTEIYLKGYKLKDRVIRHAKVMVTMPDGTAESGASAEETEEETV